MATPSALTTRSPPVCTCRHMLTPAASSLLPQSPLSVSLQRTHQRLHRICFAVHFCIAISAGTHRGLSVIPLMTALWSCFISLSLMSVFSQHGLALCRGDQRAGAADTEPGGKQYRRCHPDRRSDQPRQATHKNRRSCFHQQILAVWGARSQNQAMSGGQLTGLAALVRSSGAIQLPSICVDHCIGVTATGSTLTALQFLWNRGHT